MDEAIAMARVLDRLAQHSYQIAAEKLARLREDLSILVIRYDPTSLRYAENQRTRLAALIDEAERTISQTYVEIAARVDQDLLNAERLAQDSLSVLVASLLIVKGLSRRMDDEVLVTVRDQTLITGATAREWIAKQSGDLQFRTGSALGEAMSVRRTTRLPVLNDLLDAIRSNAPGSLFSAPPRHIESLIISAHHAVANSVRYETITRHPELFRAVMHLSLIDGKTTSICKSRANKLFKLDGSGIGHRMTLLVPPIHYLCRSHIVPVMHSYDDLSPRIQKRVKRADYTGAAVREPDLTDWLRERSLERDQPSIDYPGARLVLGL